MISLKPRATHTPSSYPPPISYSIIHFTPSSQTTTIMHHKKPSTFHRPSASRDWFSRNRNGTPPLSSPYTTSKHIPIPEPRLVPSVDLPSEPRSGVLGSGATVVRTPEEALRETGVRFTYDGKIQEPGTAELLKSQTETVQPGTLKLVRSPNSSPPLPPLPLPSEDETQLLSDTESDGPEPPSKDRLASPARAMTESVVTRTVPAPSMHQTQKEASFLNIPPTPLPPFHPILLSDSPVVDDPRDTIIVLETSTITYKTTLNSLESQPSHLLEYIHALPSARPRIHSKSSSIYSTTSDDVPIIRQHLDQQNSYSTSTPRIHIFLDRPSTPYAHILTYLRAAACQQEQLMLPFGVQLIPNCTQDRIEALIELRDEAAFLGLTELHGLCEDELNSGQASRALSKSYSNGSNTLGSQHSSPASIYSLHTLIERAETNDRSGSPSSLSDSRCQGRGSAKPTPTPESWKADHSRKPSRCNPSGPPPAGWI
ncbi:hypothetical protein AMATHDRAFT_138995 [Amanita thiersii Skay4041]|uniref:Uncharacterized protein n=1 Tax=Amanita thiersii Skay4041 TaxID=703135 RepID=A0A2A9NXU8_9AGAR|nr:hypothetical protein AMATHDRAFT_138995 [Amanita thiersii Skay4041]